MAQRVGLVSFGAVLGALGTLAIEYGLVVRAVIRRM